MSKRCGKCQRDLPLSDYPTKKNRGRVISLRLCRECERERAGEVQRRRRQGAKGDRRRILQVRWGSERADEILQRLAAQPPFPFHLGRAITSVIKAIVRSIARASKTSARLRYQARYARDPQGERDRIRSYKLRNPHRHSLWERKRAERLARLSDGSVGKGTFWKVLQARKCCPYCRTKLTPQNRTIDHIIPLARGGHHAVSNLVACCIPCNLRKGPRPFGEWLALLSGAARRRAESLYVSRYRALPDQLTLSLAFTGPGTTPKPRVSREPAKNLAREFFG
jgi:5-methylcytosine-specific restriction endonuclease McrA